MLPEKHIDSAIKIGVTQADRVMAFRDKQLDKRASVMAMQPQAVRSRFQPDAFISDFVNRLGPRATEVLIAEGDSWFDYPLNDVLQILEDDHGYDVESVAHKGDRVEDMAYSDGQLEEFVRRLEKLMRNGAPIPRAILLSGGGNDVAGDEFRVLLNHKASAIFGLNDSVVDGIIKERIMTSYLTLISMINRICENRIGHRLPILVHGYDYAVPDGRGFLGGWGFLPGPWFEPGFREKGFIDRQEMMMIVRELIDRFNDMLKDLQTKFENVHYVDLRGTLSTAGNYQDDWDNELHPTEEGFKKITSKFARVIAGLPL
jgi:lysophospholipase L1-like esterase